MFVAAVLQTEEQNRKNLDSVAKLALDDTKPESVCISFVPACYDVLLSSNRLLLCYLQVRSLVERLESYDAGAAENQHGLVQFPPAFMPGISSFFLFLETNRCAELILV